MALTPAVGTVRILSLNQSAGRAVKLRLLGTDQHLQWNQTAQALEIDFRGIETGVNGFAVEVTLESQTDPSHP